MQYDLELDRVISEIQTQKAKLVLIQLPDGLKPKAEEIQHEIETNTSAKVIIWLGSCFGACDIPEIKEADIIIQFGHSGWR